MGNVIFVFFFRALCDVCCKETPLSVFTHGDAWAPNFLIKYNDYNVPEQALLVDFQLARYMLL